MVFLWGALHQYLCRVQRYSRTSGSWQDQYFLVEAESLAADFGSINFVCHMAPQSLFCHVRLLSSLLIQLPAALGGQCECMLAGMTPGASRLLIMGCLSLQDLLMAIHRHDGGRVTVLRDELKVYGADGSVEVRNMKTLEDFKEALALFGIPVPGAQ